ncbi:hypothetical protein HPB49_007954 [Dermacentor silvarum]|uniref:Uncharacterized protein n=1 Tax=Dermacentor silvarum TaxID=543639 RepID=A0ACB8C858_DERSI|nr:hypothetical protein HPB49_007954 [Dermacentor silvarum]
MLKQARCLSACSDNRLSVLSPLLFDKMTSLRRVYLNGNRLTTLDRAVWSAVWSNPRLGVEMHGNPVVCDRRLCWLARLVPRDCLSRDCQRSPADYRHLDGRCNAPPPLAGRHLAHVDCDALACGKECDAAPRGADAANVSGAQEGSQGQKPASLSAATAAAPAISASTATDAKNGGVASSEKLRDHVLTRASGSAASMGASMAEAEEVGDVSASVEDDHAASMDLDSTSSKRRHDGATCVLQEQRLRQPEQEWRVAGKKPRVTRAQRSSSLPRDDTEKS